MEDSTPIADLLNALHDIPAGGVVALALIMTLGLVLWLAGRNVLRVALALGGLVVGGLIGWTVGSMFELPFPAWVAGLGAGAIAACMAALSFRMILAAGLATVLSMAAIVATWIAWEMSHPETATSTPVSGRDDPRQVFRDAVAGEGDYSPDNLDANGNDVVSWIHEHFNVPDDVQMPEDVELPEGLSFGDLRDQLLAQGIDLPENSSEAKILDLAERAGIDPDQANEAITDAQDFATRVSAALVRIWEQTPQSLRTGIVIAGILGGVLGMLLGTLSPTTSAMVVSAGGGAALWLPAAATLATRFGVPLDQGLGTDPRLWVGVWAVLLVIGLSVQWRRQRKKADKTA